MGTVDSNQHRGPASQGVPPSTQPQGPESRGFGGEAAPLDPTAKAAGPLSADVRRNLGVGGGGKLRKWIWRLVVLIVLGGLVAGGVIWWRGRAADKAKVEYVTKPVTRGNLEATVTATGSLQGRDTVEVGAEISGTVKAVHVDFNDEVQEGQVLCEIDPQQLAAARDQTRAQLSAAQAEYSSRKITAKEARQTADRTKALEADGLVSKQQLETALAAADRAEAAARSAAAQITVTRASLESAQTKLDKTKIIAPMDGVVLARSVEVGQTVAASLQAPVLFTLARNLREMELTVAIDEADIGQVKEGQAATFVVDAFPERTFGAELKSIRNIGTVVDNVVTYEALLSVTNDELLLRPGMTATATIVSASRKDVMLVPNAALRFSPPRDESRRPGGPGLPGVRMRGMPRGKRPQGAASASPSAAGSARKGPRGPRTRVWLVVDGQPQPVPLKTGLTDGQHTEVLKVLRGELAEGTEVITDMKTPEE